MKVTKDQNTPIEYSFQFIVYRLVTTIVKIQNVNCIIKLFCSSTHPIEHIVLYNASGDISTNLYLNI